MESIASDAMSVYLERWSILDGNSQFFYTLSVTASDEALVGLAVVVEIAALPLVHSAWITAVVWSVANAILLRERVAVENAALDLHRVRESKTGS